MKKLLILVFIILLSSCAATQDKWNNAERICESHGGVKYYYLFPVESILCNDDTYIKRWKKQ